MGKYILQIGNNQRWEVNNPGLERKALHKDINDQESLNLDKDYIKI